MSRACCVRCSAACEGLGKSMESVGLRGTKMTCRFKDSNFEVRSRAAPELSRPIGTADELYRRALPMLEKELSLGGGVSSAGGTARAGLTRKFTPLKLRSIGVQMTKLAQDGAPEAGRGAEDIAAGLVDVVRHLDPEGRPRQHEPWPQTFEDLPQHLNPLIDDGSIEIAMPRCVRRFHGEPVVQIALGAANLLHARERPEDETGQVVAEPQASGIAAHERACEFQVARCGQHRMQRRSKALARAVPAGAGRRGALAVEAGLSRPEPERRVDAGQPDLPLTGIGEC